MIKEFVTERLKLKDLYPDRAKALSKEQDIAIEDLELVRKGVIAEKAEVSESERAVTSYVSTGVKDRDNDILEPEGAILTHYRKNPVVPYSHDYGGLPVGKNIWIKKNEKGLIAKTVFNKHQFADDVYRLYSEDVEGTGPAMKGWSVGFIPLKWEELNGKGAAPKAGEKDNRIRRRYKKWELQEYSAVMVPSNPEALTVMVEKGLIKSDKLKEEIIACVDDECATKETITKPEETETQIRIPVRDCKVTATIPISAKQGITALYCGKVKKIRTYLFDKRPPYNWTMKRAVAWVKEHEKGVDDLIDRWNKDDYLRELFDTYLEEKAKYNCECIKCGHKLTSDKHCRDLECPKCGGQMRRIERPGPGQESEEVLELELDETKEPKTEKLIERIEILADEIKSLKEGRVLSEKNRKLVKQCADMLLQLYAVTEPQPQEELEIDIDLEKTAADKIARVPSTTGDGKIEIEKGALTDMIESVLKDRLKQLTGKVE